MNQKDAKTLNGREIAKRRMEQLVKKIAALQSAAGRTPALAAVRIGDQQDSLLYSKSIESLTKRLGVVYTAKQFAGDVPESRIFREIAQLNDDPLVTGIMIFSPLPKPFNKTRLMSPIDFLKDVEGERFYPFASEGLRVIPPTAAACLALIEETGCDFAGKDAVVIGRSNVVGKPAALLLIERHATVTVCHSKTKDLEDRVRQADIVIATVGKPQLVKGSWIKKGAIVIDVGENVVDGKIVGDCDFEAVKRNASFVSPVPGGVGPITNVMLMENLCILFEMSRSGSSPS